jgi:hypothetical protein
VAWDDVYFCEDSDLIEEAPGDYPELLGRGQTYAYATDGVTANWTLTSASVDFDARNVFEGAAVVMSPRGTSASATLMRMQGDTFLVDSVASAHVLNLRRPGLGSGDGAPPVAASALEYWVATLRPRIKQESNWVRRQLDFDESGDLVSDDDRRRLTVYRTLASAYRAASTYSDDNADDFTAKAQEYMDAAGFLLAELQGRRQSVNAVDTISVVPVD